MNLSRTKVVHLSLLWILNEFFTFSFGRFCSPRKILEGEEKLCTYFENRGDMGHKLVIRASKLYFPLF